MYERAAAWGPLAHVCRRWRSIVFGFPRHLDLQVLCTTGTRVRDMLDIWPTLPLIIMCDGDSGTGVDNIIAALERRDRVCRIHTYVRSSDLEIYLAAMQQPFPELTDLGLWSNDETVPVVTDSFLGGCAPRLEFLNLSGILFPGLLKLLLSATHLVNLHLFNIPHSGYISPDAIVTVLSTLTSLGRLSLGFRSPRSCPDLASRRLPPSTRSILPALTHFWFKGVSEYLEDLVASIDTPQLDFLDITFFNDIIFDTPQFIQFISRTPTLRALEEARIELWDGSAGANFSSQRSGYGNLDVTILCRGLDWQLSSLEQVCTSCLPLRVLSMLEDLYFFENPYSQLDRKDNLDSENGPWLLLHPFTAVKNLYLSKEFAPLIAFVLQERAESRTAQVLPALRNIFLEGFESSEPVQEGIGQFVAARQVTGHPIAVSRWDRPS
jgi:hypothetical protein